MSQQDKNSVNFLELFERPALIDFPEYGPPVPLSVRKANATGIERILLDYEERMLEEITRPTLYDRVRATRGEGVAIFHVNSNKGRV